MSYVKKSFSINASGVDESDTDVGFVAREYTQYPSLPFVSCQEGKD